MGGDDRSKSLPNDAPPTEESATAPLLESVTSSVEAGSVRVQDASRSILSPVEAPRPLTALAGNTAERFQRLVHDHEAVVHALARKLCRSHFDADDLVQDVFERALRHFDRLTPGTSERAWLCTITRNLFIDRIRRRRTAPPATDSEARDVVAPVDEPVAPWRTLEPEQLRNAVARLGHKLREVYVMHAFEGIDYTTIAARLAIPKATVGTRLLLARQKLKQLLMAETGVGS
jgi:RNA polymerase sigma-70 factor (ECF subfamily)